MDSDTRTLLVAAAADLLDLGGPPAVTLREVGRRAGVSHNAPYKHFKSKEDLLAAIASRELDRQARAMGAAAAKTGRPIEQLRRLMHGYIQWARAYPQRFQLTFGPWTHDSQELATAASRSRARLIDLARTAQHAGELGPGNPERIAYLMLSLAHGAVHLALAGHLSAKGKGGADPEMLIDDLFRLLRRRPNARRAEPKPP